MRNEIKTAKIFKSGNSQAVRLPKAFQFDAEEVVIHQQNGVLMIHKKTQTLEQAFNILISLSEDFMESGRNQPPMQNRDNF